MDNLTRKFLGIAAVSAMALHTFTDILEWMQGGFSTLQLWLNYLAFLPVPVIMIGLYAAQWRKRSFVALTGAAVYGFAFIYFAHTTVTAIKHDYTNYESLLKLEGPLYTINGALMIFGGTLFGVSALRNGTYPKLTVLLFLFGLGVSLLVSLIPVPDILQTIGTLFRNAGLIGMGIYLIRNPELTSEFSQST